MSETKSIDEILGIERAPHASLLDMSKRIEEGFSIATFENVAGEVAPDDRTFVFRIVPLGTLKRRKAKRQHLSARQSERIKRLADAFRAAMEVFDDRQMAREFLRRPHPMLERQAPRDVVLKNQAGLDTVVQILGRGQYGSAA